MKTTPILVANTEWSLPESLIKDIKSERMVNGLLDMASPNTLDKEDLVGWAECVGYLMPATSRSVLRKDVTEIYLYCVKKLFERQKKAVPKEFRDIELSNYQQQKLKEYKLWIYEKRGGKEKNPIIDALSFIFIK